MHSSHVRFTGAAAALVMVITSLGAALSIGLAAGPAQAASGDRAVAARTMSSPFAREAVRRGARDAGPRHIAHVREVQLRLKRLGLYRSSVDGRYGAVTQKAVRAFQTRYRLKVTGVVGPAEWTQLIRRTTLGRSPKTCLGSGWHMCIDRKRHQASLYRGGKLWNSWLVRTGARRTQTRTGNFTVFMRDIDHVSHQFGGKMPYSQFFSGGEALHGSVLMTNPFVGHSHGCVNFFLEDARQLWKMTHSARLKVTVYGAWD